VIAWREARAVMRGMGVYVALALALVAATWVLLIDVRALEAAGLLVLADPFRSPLAIAMLVLAAFLALSAAVSTARDRESGTLEVLFYAPVDEISCVLGKVGGLLVVYVAALPILFASFALLALITGFALTPAILLSLALSIVPVAEVVSFGVLLSVGTSRVRTAVLLLVGATAVLLGAALAYGMVLLVPITDPSSPVLALRDALAAVDAIVWWISPFAYLERVVDGALTGAWRNALMSLAAAVAYTLLMMAGAAYWLRRRGVYRRSE
jgi:ABC-type transport system involved in multi-copper enzyme maturation permease subunit